MQSVSPFPSVGSSSKEALIESWTLIDESMGLIIMNNTQQKGVRDRSQYNLIFPFNDALAEQSRLGFAPSPCTIELDKDIKADGHTPEPTDSILRSHIYKRLSYTRCNGNHRTYA